MYALFIFLAFVVSASVSFNLEREKVFFFLHLIDRQCNFGETITCVIMPEYMPGALLSRIFLFCMEDQWHKT